MSSFRLTPKHREKITAKIRRHVDETRRAAVLAEVEAILDRLKQRDDSPAISGVEIEQQIRRIQKQADTVVAFGKKGVSAEARFRLEGAFDAFVEAAGRLQEIAALPDDHRHRDPFHEKFPALLQVSLGPQAARGAKFDAPVRMTLIDLARLWERETGHAPTFHGKDSTGGPFAAFFQAAVRAVRPRFGGMELVRKHVQRKARQRRGCR